MFKVLIRSVLWLQYSIYISISNIVEIPDIIWNRAPFDTKTPFILAGLLKEHTSITRHICRTVPEDRADE